MTYKIIVNYRPMFDFGPTERQGNAQVFATKEEALGSARDRWRRWTMPTGFSAEETDAPVNYRWSLAEGDVSLLAKPNPTKDEENLTMLEKGGEDWIYPY